MLKVAGKTFKRLFAVSVLALAVIVSLACEGPAPTPPAPTAAAPDIATATPPATTPAPATATAIPPAAAATPVAPTPAPPTTPTPTAAGVRIDWKPCGDLECGFIEVPADYRDPEAGSIRIAVNVHRATSPDQRIGYLLVNPGGPGGSGLGLAYGAVVGWFTDEIVERFDIVGFDPRGVNLSDKLVAAFDKAGIDPSVVGGGSEPEFACGDLGERLALLASIDGEVDTHEEIAIGEAAANLCIQSMGPVGGRLHSAYVARDIDEIRKALGAEQISYLGFSYGAELGVWYATLFPDSVRAMAVDGARNPFPSDQEDDADAKDDKDDKDDVDEYAVRLEAALTACADPQCVIYNDGDPVGYFRQAIAKIDLVNAAAKHPRAGYMGVISATFNEEDWPDLWQGLFELNENDDPSILLEYARQRSYIRELGASFNDHVTCLDKWVLDPEGQRARYTRRVDRANRQQEDRATRPDDSIPADANVAEMLDLINVSIPSVCPFFHQFAPEPLGEAFYGGGVPILVVGNRDDPRTSFRDSEAVATEVLSNGYLVETSHYKHVAYPQNQCVNDHVHRALIDLALPSARRVFCEEDRTFAPGPAAEPEPAPTGEQIDWTPCGSLECGSILVPADYRDPAAGSINIAVNVHRATAPDQRIGYLLVNPGGPGGSGLEMAFFSTLGAFSDEIIERFDIVGFDPRGVGLSDLLVILSDKVGGFDLNALVGGGSGPEFACGGLGEQLALLNAIEGPVDSPEETAAGEAAANLCIETMGPVGGLLHTEYVANDMDEIRKALGAEQISYYGGSYGSTVGVWYATLFPDSVRAMVVDGADNPVDQAANQQERVAEELEELEAMEGLLEKAFTACADPECPIYNDGDPVGYYLRAAQKLGLVNAAADNHPEAGLFGVVSNLYSEEQWPDLWQGLFELNENDDPALLLESAKFQWLGGEFGEARLADHVNCLDAWVLHPEVDRASQLDDSVVTESLVEEQLPLITAANPFSVGACPFYDQFAPEPLEEPLDGGGVPILVVGNRSDPATPFSESEELATETLSNGYLVETTHYTHVVYPQNECVNEHVDRALIDGELPSERRVFCEEDRTFAP